MQCSNIKLTLAFSLALGSCTALASTATPPEPHWQVVPEQELNQYRGGVDLGPLVASFAIQRTIEVDGVVVARMEIVISNLDNLGNGGAPTVSVSGPVAALVQIMDKSGVAATASAAQSLQTNGPAGVTSNTSPALAASQTGSGLATNGQSTPGTVAAGGNGGSVQNGGQQTGSSAQFGNALNTATSVANGAIQGATGSSSSSSVASASPAATSGSPGTTSVTANIPTSNAGTATSVVPAGTPIVVMPAAMSASGSNSSLATSKTVALGNTGQVAVISNLPNAAAMTTAIQNEARGATIQAQTTISATLNSLSSLNSLSLASQISKQVAGATAGM